MRYHNPKQQKRRYQNHSSNRDTTKKKSRGYLCWIHFALDHIEDRNVATEDGQENENVKGKGREGKEEQERAVEEKEERTTPSA